MIPCDIDPYPFIRQMHWESNTHLTSVLDMEADILNCHMTHHMTRERERETLNITLMEGLAIH